MGYERIKGLRAIGQRRNGAFEASKSRTFAVPLDAPLRRLSRPAHPRALAPGVELMVRSATRGKYMRIAWPDRTSVAVGFRARARQRARWPSQHEKLPDQASAKREKEYWSERLDALKEILAAR